MVREDELQRFWKSYEPLLSLVESVTAADPSFDRAEIQKRAARLQSQLQVPQGITVNWKACQVGIGPAWYDKFIIGNLQWQQGSTALTLRPCYAHPAHAGIVLDRRTRHSRGFYEPNLFIHFNPRPRPQWKHVDKEFVEREDVSTHGTLIASRITRCGKFISKELDKAFDAHRVLPPYYTREELEEMNRTKYSTDYPSWIPRKRRAPEVMIGVRLASNKNPQDDSPFITDTGSKEYVAELRFHHSVLGTGELDATLEHLKQYF
ncbi:hypothetical protein GF342_02970 [Candidatus Woesearchaeota archaeon]|nr:hypothetical protein [Candidatus Woesearchaeota archaeon]